ncbi:MAG: crotonase/enoyl-CoA hydratase family protein [Myxococcota bacterium]|nr:crotonase/enoyl-CoA hydratase family protein [Myxococcota bacterium]
MSNELVSYELRDSVALLGFDDGKANVIGPTAQAALHAGLDRAEKEARAVVLAGRSGRFSAGFDLAVMRAGGDEVVRMVRGGAELALRLYSFPLPVVAAVTGHALAMGAVLLLAVDERISASGDFKIGLNETAIGMTLPDFALILTRERLAPTHLTRATLNAEIFGPAGAVAAGFLDQVVPAEELPQEAFARASALAALDVKAHHATKRSLRKLALAALQESLSAVG